MPEILQLAFFLLAFLLLFGVGTFLNEREHRQHQPAQEAFEPLFPHRSHPGSRAR